MHVPSGPPDVAAILVAAGRGSRLGGDMPKQYRHLAGKPVLRWTVEAFAHHPAVSSTLVVIHPDDRNAYEEAVAGIPGLLPPALGGRSRQESGLNGLRSLESSPPGIVLIHDAARPFVSADLIDRIIAAARDGLGAIPGLPVTDTLKRVEAGRIATTLARADIVSVQTPQAFPFDAILRAHQAAREAGRDDLTDDAAIAELAGIAVAVVPGEPGNTKITTAADLELGEARLRPARETRTGQGIDVHAFGPGDSVWLCGVRIPHSQALQGHSDADVGLHALTDAVLGAIGDGDIGEHFPPSDPAWKGASSDRFLADAVRRLRDRGGRINNLDVTIVCEEPRIGPHRDVMRQAVARIAGIDPGRVAVKATTSERMGFTGRKEGILAIATATVQVPESG